MDRRLCLALDVDNPNEALEIAKELKSLIGVFKVGPRLTNLTSPDFIKELSRYAPVFVDHKYYDIPSTMEGAVRSIFAAGAAYTTIHASSGSRALVQMAKLEAELNQQREFRVLAVTMLTSFAPTDLPNYLSGISIPTQVQELAKLSLGCGISGLVCSPQELKEIRSISSQAFIVTPGIRLSNSAQDDQTRTLTPKEAVGFGASMVIVGRPILNAPNRIKATESILKELA